MATRAKLIKIRNQLILISLCMINSYSIYFACNRPVILGPPLELIPSIFMAPLCLFSYIEFALELKCREKVL